MLSKNIYKPRYKIAFQSKSKIWPYKNSRLRRFFNIRGRKLVRRGLFKRYFLVFNNMKWTIARRYIRPYMKKRRALKRKFRNIFYTKQQLRVFYGKQKEFAFRNFFKNYLGGAKGRNNIFAAALERRADVFLFRLRLLPTIYASHQYIHHFGIIINGRKEVSPYALVTPGDIVTFEKEQWLPFVEYLYERLYWRVHGLNLWKRRQFKSLRKKSWWFNKMRFFKKTNLNLLRKFNFITNNVLKINKIFLNYLLKLVQKLKLLDLSIPIFDIEKKLEVQKLRGNVELLLTNYKLNFKVLIKRFLDLTKQKWRLKLWKWRNYYSQYFTMVGLLFKMYSQFKHYFVKVQLMEVDLYKIKALTYVANEKTNLMRKKLFNNIQDTILEVNNNEKAMIQIINEKIFSYKMEYKYLYYKNAKLNQQLNWIKVKLKKVINYNWTASSYGAFHFKKQNKLKTKYLLFMENKLIKANLIRKRMSFVWKKIKHFSNKKHSLESSIAKFFIQLTAFTKENASKHLNDSLHNLLNNKSSLLNKKLIIFKTRMELLLNFILKSRIKRFHLKARLTKNYNSGKYSLKKTNIMYYLTKRRLKKERKLALPRLKRVHWYLPSYIYFDSRTMRAVFLYNPKAEEIMHSFKCSLKDVHSFYRALGI